jgi:DMSO reductase family type II enzyme heme b subunit
VKVRRQALNDIELADGRASAWSAVEGTQISLAPSPIALTESVSPYMSKSADHGKVDRLDVQMTHNGTTLSIRVTWRDPDKDDEINDLDQFTDGVAIMFPIQPGASAFTMGSADKPVNAWFWKADEADPFDIYAEGYSSSQRRNGSTSGLKANGYHEEGSWTVVFQRPMRPETVAGEQFAVLDPEADNAIAFAIWEGSNYERSGQKSVSGEFVELSIEG